MEEREHSSILVKGYSGTGKTELWALLCRELSDAGFLVAGYRVRRAGLSWSARVLLSALYDTVSKKLGRKDTPGKSGKKIDLKKLKQIIGEYRSDFEKSGKSCEKIVVILDGTHNRQFAPKHFTSVVNELYLMGLHIICFALPYPGLDHFFNTRIGPGGKPSGPEQDKIAEVTEDYLYDKGPDPDESKDARDKHTRLQAAVSLLWNKVSGGTQKSHNLREFSGAGNDFSYPVLEEAAYILSPFVELNRKKFEEDSVDDYTYVVRKRTEMTFPYMVLRRRDIAMEYEGIHVKAAFGGDV